MLNLVGHADVIRLVCWRSAGRVDPSFRMAVEEAVYVVEGQGIATIWAEGHPKVTFEFQKNCLFRVPANYYYELANARGDQRVRTLHVSYLPMAMGIDRNEDFFFKSDFVDPSELYSTEGFANDSGPPGWLTDILRHEVKD